MFACFTGTVFMVQYVNAVIYLKHRSALLNKKLLSKLSTWPLRQGRFENDLGTNSYYRQRNLTSVINQQSINLSTGTHFENIISRPQVISVNGKGKAMPNILRKSSHVVVVNTYRKVHNELCEVTHLINSSYGFAVLILYASNFISVVSCLHYVISTVSQLDTTQHNQTTLYEVTSISFGTALSVATIMAVTAACHFASSELQGSADIVHKLLLQRSIDSEASLELQQFSMHLLCNRVQFTACGFFPIDLSLLCTIIGAVATYIIILFQF
jgi:hypothetical protein